MQLCVYKHKCWTPTLALSNWVCAYSAFWRVVHAVYYSTLQHGPGPCLADLTEEGGLSGGPMLKKKSSIMGLLTERNSPKICRSLVAWCNWNVIIAPLPHYNLPCKTLSKWKLMQWPSQGYSCNGETLAHLKNSNSRLHAFVCFMSGADYFGWRNMHHVWP